MWELTVEPAGTAAVTILAPLDRACTETGALCTADGQALSTGLGAQRAGSGAAGAAGAGGAGRRSRRGFVSVPAEHDGQTAFWLELTFDAAVAQGSKRHIRALLGVTGGSERRMRRKDERLDHRRIKIQPSSHEAVTVTLSPSPPCGQGRGGVHGGRAHVHDCACDANPGPARARGRECGGAGSGERDALPSR